MDTYIVSHLISGNLADFVVPTVAILVCFTVAAMIAAALFKITNDERG